MNLLLASVTLVCCFTSIYGKDLTQIPGSLKHVSTSINYLWGVNSNNRIYRCSRPCNGQWAAVDGTLKQIDVSDMEVWGVNRHDFIYKRPADGSGSWVRVGGLLKHVSASGNGYIWGVNSADSIFLCKKPCNGQWKHIPGKLKQIDGGEEYVFGVNSANRVYRRPVDGSSHWKLISQKKMKYVSIGAGKVFGVDESSKLFACDLPCNNGNWMDLEICTALDQVEATIGGAIVGTRTGAIYKGTVHVV